MIRVAADVRRPPAHIARAIEARAPFFWEGFEEVLSRSLEGLPLVVTSWWRTPEQNRAADGATDSQHLVGTALDVDGDQAAIARAAARARAFRLVVVGPYTDGHLHLQGFRSGQLRAAGVFRELGL